MDLTHTNNRQELITAIYEKVDRAFEDAAFIDIPQITRDVFEMEGTVQELLGTPQFNAVCEAVDLLIDEGSIHFDASNGHLVRV